MFRNIIALAEKSSVPLSLLTLAALTPRRYKIKIFNYKTFWAWWDFPKGALVGITCYSANVQAAYKIAGRYRQKGAYVVMGGPHVSSLPDEALDYCDSVVIGEAESVWGEVITDFENNTLKKKYTGLPREDFFTPVYDYFINLKPSQIINSGIQTTRGCKYHCDFCARPFVKYRTIPHEQVLALVQKVRPFVKWQPIYLKDDNIYSDPQHAKELFKKLAPLKVKWFSFSSLDIALDDEALQLAKESGCVELTIGFETIYPEKLTKTSLANRIKTPEDFLVLMRKMKSYGIRVRGAFILGFDYYTHLDYLKLLIFLVKARLSFVVLGVLTPFPGSVLYQRLSCERRIRPYPWNKFDCLHVVFKPQKISALSLQLWFIFLRLISFFLSTQTAPFFFFMAFYFLIQIFLRRS